MHRLYPVLKYAMPALFVSSLLGSLLGTCVSGLVFEDASCSVQRDIYESLTVYGPWALLGTLGLLVLKFRSRRDYLRHSALLQFALAKPAELLEPEDLGFERATSDGSARPGRRPFYETYVSRQAVTGTPNRSGAERYDEGALLEELSSGHGFVLLGQPLDGKSRTLYEILSSAAGWHILQPSLSKGMPDDEAFSLIEDQQVILLLEDLHEYAGARIVLPELHAALAEWASSCVVAATCGDGPELKLVEEKLGRFYEDIPLKLKLVGPTGEEKGTLAHGIGDAWDPGAADDYPTLGSIAMEEHLEAMSLRFRNLLRDRPDHADVLRAMKLLTTASVGALTHRRLEAALKEAFGRDELHLGDCLRSLSEQAFLKRGPATDEAVHPEPAYLRDAVTYTEGKEPRDDFFPALLYAFRDLRDADALISLGVTSMIGGSWNP